MTFFNARLERRDVLASGIHNPFENPAVPLSSVAMDTVFGALTTTDSGEVVTPDRAFALPIFWRCVGLLSTVIAGCPLRTYKNPGKKEVFPNIFSPDNFNLTYTQFELSELIAVHLAVWGNAYVLKVRGNGPAGANTGVIIDLKPINPSRVKVCFDKETGQKVFEVTQLRKDGSVDNMSKPLELSTFEIMHIPGLGYDGTIGLPVVEMAKQTLGTASAGDKLAAKFYANGTLLSGIIQVKVPLTRQSQADEIKARWQQKKAGAEHAAEVAVLDSETSFQPLTIPPDQLQFLESRRWQTTEIARWFGIPPHLVGDVEKSTSWGTGIEQQNVGFVSYTVSGWTNRIEQRMSREVVAVRKQYCEYDLDRLLRGSMSERFNAYAVGIMNGFLTRNEARIKENMTPIDGLDEPLTPMNMNQANPNEPLGTTTEPGEGAEPDDDQDEGNNP